jgi:hypothetical protein
MKTMKMTDVTDDVMPSRTRSNVITTLHHNNDIPRATRQRR